ncbi:hypothetical protein N7466_010358 [Penicillium verhagenii]|uniref:uncharacterized protein n=1 Tax=Penicillium verhagenii TaxID=1562060 RepID=UPI0025453BD0|nr:uncharacterized protein N7466_010358 [Penicillium verhagenii]KAJ5919415.1 hypothetical protein N7466_010358 [Penicillium verhagenii]
MSCIFGDRSRDREKVYPKGYAALLEDQQGWLIHGIRELYRHLQAGSGWPGEPLSCEANGQPLVHNILTRLGSLENFGDNIPSGKEEILAHQQISDDAGCEKKQWPSSSKDNMQSFISARATPIAPVNTLPSSTAMKTDYTEAENTLSRSSRINVIGSKCSAESMLGAANDAGLPHHDFQSSTGMHGYPTGNDSINSSFFSGIENETNDWDTLFNPSSESELTREEYWARFYEAQALLF